MEEVAAASNFLALQNSEGKSIILALHVIYLHKQNNGLKSCLHSRQNISRFTLMRIKIVLQSLFQSLNVLEMKYILIDFNFQCIA